MCYCDSNMLLCILGLTGLNKAETAAKHGEKQVQIWRRSFDTPPPPMDLIHPYYNIIVNDARYRQIPTNVTFNRAYQNIINICDFPVCSLSLITTNN